MTSNASASRSTAFRATDRGRPSFSTAAPNDQPSSWQRERTGGVRHFVEKPETFISDLINAGVYVFSPSVFRRIAAGRAVSMNELLPGMADEEQLHPAHTWNAGTRGSFTDARLLHRCIAHTFIE
mgnify:CR=1 FL=1